MKRVPPIRVGKEFFSFVTEVEKEMPRKLKRTQLTDEMAITMRQSGIDQQVKRLMKRRYL